MKVLTLDLDYAMQSDLNYYESTCSNSNWENMSAEQQWLMRKIEWKYKEEYARIDADNATFMFEVFQKSIKHCANVQFSLKHHNILHYLQSKTDLEIINIDHHHDMFYTDDQVKYSNTVDYSDIGCWVYYLFRRNKLKKYTWIKNSTSIPFHHSPGVRDNFLSKSHFSSKEQFNFSDYRFDYIHVCFSPDYIPSQYWFMFNMYISAYENTHGKADIIKDDFKPEFCKIPIQTTPDLG